MKKSVNILIHFLWITLAFIKTGNAQTDSTKINSTTTTTTTVTSSTSATGANEQPKPGEKSENVSDDYSKVFIGARFMPTVTKFEVRTIENGVAKTNFVIGYGAGGLLGFNFSKNVGLQAEVIYSVLSQKFTDNDLEKTIKLSYLHIPLLLTLNTDVSNPVNLNICAGPQIGINTGSSIDTKGSQGVDTVSAIIAVKPADLGIAYGAGLDFRVAPAVSLGLGFRGVYGILDISEKSKSITTNQYYILDRSHVKTYAGYIGINFNF